MTSKRLISSDNFFKILLLLALAVGIYVASGYLIAAFMGIVIAYTFRPLHKWLLKRTAGRKSIAAIITDLIIILVVIIPLIITLIITFYQLRAITNNVNLLVQSGQLNLNAIATQFNQTVAQVPLVEAQVSAEQLREGLTRVVQPIGNAILQILLNAAGSALSLIAQFFVFFYALNIGLNQFEKLEELIKRLVPLPKDLTQKYMHRIMAMAEAMLKGIFLVAIVQGVVSAIFLEIVGVPYVFLWGLLATLFSIIPIGAGFVVIPIGLVLLLIGDVTGGLILILGNTFVVSNIDNIMRPKLTPKEVNLPEVLTLIALLGGLQLFGFLGLIIGPVLMIFAVTTFQIYMEQYGGKDS